MKKKKINYFNTLVLITAIVTSFILIHDFILWGIVPLFTGDTVTITYFGMFVDMISMFLLDTAFEFIETW